MDASDGFTHYQEFNDVRDDISDIELEELEEEDELHVSGSIGQEHSESFASSSEIGQDDTIPYAVAMDNGGQSETIPDENRSKFTMDYDKTVSHLDMIAFEGGQNETIPFYDNMSQIVIDDSQWSK